MRVYYYTYIYIYKKTHTKDMPSLSPCPTLFGSRPFFYAVERLMNPSIRKALTPFLSRDKTTNNLPAPPSWRG